MSFSGNSFSTTQYILDETFIRFINYLNFAKVANRNLEGDFKGLKYATGQTINYRLEERYMGGYGATATSEARVQVIRPLTIDTQFHTMVEFSGFELTFERARDQPYLDMMLNPRAKRLANMVEQFIATTNFQTQVFQAYGSPGVAIDFNTILQTDAYMTQLGIPEDGNRYWANPPAVSATLTNDLYTVFNMTVNRGALLDGFIGHLSGFDFFKTNFLQRQIAGTPGATGGSPPTGYVAAGTIANGPITGGNTFQVTGVSNTLNQVLFNVGDILTLDPAAGVFMVNPLTYEPLSQTAQFVVTQQVLSNGTTTSPTFTVSPTIVISGARQNISAAIPNGAQVYLASSHNVSMAFHNQAIVFAAPPIKELKGGVEAVTAYSDLYKMAMTYSLGADIRNYVQLDRIDIIAGVAINPEFAVIVMS
ncbi:Major capsid protein Gp5 [uncultured Caudovirales phage]|uniref:Major capsid protein Gp5 n=1 Tax=uncultured Caudovirales phage TaxID=2100421 RepID=A0A6J5LLW2_9CAUD|nr:Major capsid protein Gp5 [uncultured Caudovirales phage]